MPEPVRPSQRYMPGLDGLRAIAVLAVIAYHLGFGWAPGGLLGVGVFFTLSGYLITDLLLAQWASRRDRLGRFWLARARRLLPALFLMLAVVMAWVTVIGPHQPPSFAEAVAAAALLREQLVADLPARLLLRALRAALAPEPPLVARRSRSSSTSSGRSSCCSASASSARSPLPSGMRPRLAGVTLLPRRRLGDRDGAALPPELRHLAGLLRNRHAGVRAPGRRRAGDGLAEPRCCARGSRAGARRILDGLGVAGLIVIAVMIWRTNQYSPFLYRGGFVLLALATALVIAALAHPACRLGPVLGWRPAALDRGALIRHLPLALADHRADHAGRRSRRRPAARRPPGGGDVARCRALVAIRRAADPPRRARAPLDGSSGPAELAPGAVPRRRLGWPVTALLGVFARRLRRTGGGRARARPSARAAPSESRHRPQTVRAPTGRAHGAAAEAAVLAPHLLSLGRSTSATRPRRA